MYQRHLASEDEALTRLFEEQISSFSGCDDTEWDERMTLILVRAGYSVQT